jgi:hypothetical protein
MSNLFLHGLSRANQAMISDHLTKTAMDEKAAVVSMLADKLKKSTRAATAEEAKGPQYPSVVAAKKAKAGVSLPMLGKEARVNPMLAGGLLGALSGGAREFAALRGAARAGMGGMGSAASIANQAAQKGLSSGGKYIRSNAEVRAAKNLNFMKNLRSLPKGQKWKAYVEPVLTSAAKWGAGGAIAGKGLSTGVRAYKMHKLKSMAKKYALPVAAGLVGTKILLD